MSSDQKPTYLNCAVPIEDRVDDLLAQMTLEEKISQMVHDASAIERLGVPEYNWWNECLHGVSRAGLATVFPQAIGLAATWDTDLHTKVATAISDEARAKHNEALRLGIRAMYVGLTCWSPNINIFRDPRWGRGQETYGEDPYLTAAMGIAFIKALQGDDPDYLKLVATPKHFAAHSGPELLRHSFDAVVGERDMRETYLPHFEACIKDGGAKSIMGAYNRTNGEACCASHTLLGKILREEWGFDGYVVSDCAAIQDIYLGHKIVETPEEAAALAVKNGCDLNCGEVYPALLEAIDRDLIAEDLIDLSVKRLLKARFQLGLFDPAEQVPFSNIPFEVVNSPEHGALSLQAARESIVLLKNEDSLLPLSKDLKSIAVIGPNANNLLALLGNYNGTPFNPVMPLEGIRKKLNSSAKIYTAVGCALTEGVPPLEPIPAANLRPSADDVEKIGVKAEYFDNTRFAGEPVLDQVDPQIDFIWKGTTPVSGQWGDSFSVRWTGVLVPPVSGTYRLGVSGLNDFKLYIEDELMISNADVHHPVVITKDVDLEADLRYNLRMEYVNRGLDPQVQLLWSIPGVDYQLNAVEEAAKADVIIAVMGLTVTIEREEMPYQVEGFPGGDRGDIRLPATQRELLKQLHALGKPVVLVILSGSAVAVPWAADNLPAIVQAWYPGQSGGDALADVLFGDYDPAGRMPVTCYRSLGDLPPFEDYQMENRTYRYFRGKALYPFGFGLSYTSFQYGNLHIEPGKAKPGEKVTLTVDVTNTGDRPGDEVVQLYVAYPDSAVPRPIKELKGFKRVHIQAGETKTLAFHLSVDQLVYYESGLGYVVEPGIVDIMLGSSSEDIRLSGELEVVGKGKLPVVERVFLCPVEVR